MKTKTCGQCRHCLMTFGVYRLKCVVCNALQKEVRMDTAADHCPEFKVKQPPTPTR